MESKRQLKNKLVLLKKNYITFNELRILMGVSGQYIQKIRNEIASEQDLFCPYNPTLIDSEAVLKRYGLDKQLRMLEIKRKIKENEQNEN